MNLDMNSLIALGALIATTLMLVAALGQALGPRGRAGVSRMVDFFVSKTKKEEPNDSAA